MGPSLLAVPAAVLDIRARFGEHRIVLTGNRLFDEQGVAITDVTCRQPPGRGDTDEPAHHAIVFVRRGCFVRRVDGTDHLLDPTRIYCINPGDEQRYDHPHPHGDDCTSMGLDPSLLGSLWGDDPTLPSNPITSSPGIDLEHRRLLAAAHRGNDPAEIHERTLALAAAALAQVDAARVTSGRPATVRARRALVDDAREALAADPGISLVDLAHVLGVSPHHLSRTFHAGTGHTIARHRMRLRVRTALERLAGGDDRLADLAADVGFIDQSHLCRVIRTETGHTPTALRRALDRPMS
jgi:AraC-like DNA-binding protein